MSYNLMLELLQATGETLFMVIFSGCIATFLGLPLAVLLYSTRPGSLLAHALGYRLISMLINVFRSVPFIILMIAIIPLTRLITGTSIGTLAAVVPLSIAATPFIARVVEAALLEVPESLIETGQILGATRTQIIWKILLPEALPGILNALTVTLITLIGYSAMAGAIGAGGLGNLAINYGYQRFDMPVMMWTIVILIIMVQAFQMLGDQLVEYFNH